MSRINKIESALKQMNEAAFQELCDVLLAKKNSSYKTIVRSGSQAGKQKTTTGTPDTFFLLSNEKYLFIEATTQVKGLSKKLRSDLDKCCDETKTGIALSQIQEIILCFNSSLKKGIVEVHNHARKKRCLCNNL